MLDFTSIKSLSIVYSLPYRLSSLSISGLYNYKGALWENTDDWIDADMIEFKRFKMLDAWDLYFLFQLCEQGPATPPASLIFRNSQITFDFLPEATYQAIRSVIIEGAPQLLQLDHLERFPNLEHLGFSARHDFVKISRQLHAIHVLDIMEWNDTIEGMLTSWMYKDYFPGLKTLRLPHVVGLDPAMHAKWKHIRSETVLGKEIECSLLQI